MIAPERSPDDERPEDERPDDERLEQLLVAYDEALIEGGASQLSDESDLPGPQVARLRGLEETLQLLEQARMQGLADTLIRGGRADQEVAAQAENSSLAGHHVGRFELVRELGRGGFGVVFLALDPQLGRQVALKIPRPEVLVSAESKRRFVREARAAGSLEHPHLIPVYEVGEEGAFCYLATAYCPGPTLAQWLRDRETPTPPFLAAQLVLALARGVDHAHERGVLHRDIKPSNVLLEYTKTSAGVPTENLVPRLTDFGLAKLMEFADDDTRSGVLLGTPAYMAPELVEGRFREVGPTTDVYSLGVLLYEILGGRPPFRGETDVQTLQLVSRGEVPPLVHLRGNVPRDLEAIVLRCLEHDGARRYPTAGELADDLQRFLNGEPTQARPASLGRRLIKAARRHPVVAASLIAVCIAATLLTIGQRWYSRKLVTARAAVQASELERLQYRYVTDVSLAHRALVSNHIQQASELLTGWIPSAGQPDLRDFAWRYVWRQLHSEERTLEGHTDDIYCVRYSPDGRQLVTGSADRTARLWSADDGRCLAVLQMHDGEVNCVAYAPDGKLVATASDDGTVGIWDTADGSLRHRTNRRVGEIWGVAFSPDGKLLAACGTDARTVLMDTANWSETAVLGEHSNSVGTLTFSPNGKWLATGGDDFQVIVWEVASRKVKYRLPHEGIVTSLSFDEKHERLLVGTRNDRAVQMWNLKSGKLLPLTTVFHEVVQGVSFDQSGERFGVVTKEGVVELHDAIHGGRLRRLHGHPVRVWSLAFSPDGRQMATASADRTVKLWDAAVSNPFTTEETVAHARHLDLTPDGSRLVVGHDDGTFVVYDVATHAVIWKSKREFNVLGDFNGDGNRDRGYFVEGRWNLEINGADPASLAAPIRFGNAGDVPVVGDWDGDGLDDLGVYDKSGQWTLRTSAGEDAVKFGPVPRDAARVIPAVGRWSADDRDCVGLLYLNKNGWMLRLQQGTSEARIKLPGVEFDAVPFSGRWMAGSPKQFALKTSAGWWTQAIDVDYQPDDIVSLERQPQFSSDVPAAVDSAVLGAARDLARTGGYLVRVDALAISPDGQRVAVCHEFDTRLKIWDVRSGTRVAMLQVEAQRINAMCYAPDGQTLSVATSDGEVFEFSTATFRMIRRFRASQGIVRAMCYLPNSQTLITACDPGVITIWNADREVVRTMIDPNSVVIWDLAVSRDGKWLASCDRNRLVGLWNLSEGKRTAALAGHTGDVKGSAFSADGTMLASVADDGTLRLWHLATRQEVLTLTQRPEQVRDVVFTPDGNRLICVGHAADDGKAVQIWSAAPLAVDENDLPVSTP